MFRLTKFKINRQDSCGEYCNGKVYPISYEFLGNFTSQKNIIENTGTCELCILVNDDKLDPKNFLITTEINGKLVQKEKVNNMIFKFSKIVSYISSILSLN